MSCISIYDCAHVEFTNMFACVHEWVGGENLYNTKLHDRALTFMCSAALFIGGGVAVSGGWF